MHLGGAVGRNKPTVEPTRTVQQSLREVSLQVQLDAGDPVLANGFLGETSAFVVAVYRLVEKLFALGSRSACVLIHHRVQHHVGLLGCFSIFALLAARVLLKDAIEVTGDAFHAVLLRLGDGADDGHVDQCAWLTRCVEDEVEAASVWCSAPIQEYIQHLSAAAHSRASEELLQLRHYSVMTGYGEVVHRLAFRQMDSVAVNGAVFSGTDAGATSRNEQVGH